MTVTVRDNGAERVLRQFRDPRSHVDVGVLGDDAEDDHGGGITVGEIAAIHEYGLGVPQRSFLRSWVDSHSSEISAQIEREWQSVIRGRRTRAQALERLGAWVAAKIQQNLGRFPSNGLAPLAPATIARKGSTTPLIDTGQLRVSISHRVEE